MYLQINDVTHAMGYFAARGFDGDYYGEATINLIVTLNAGFRDRAYLGQGSIIELSTGERNTQFSGLLLKQF